jgi:hypothetical protein
VTYPQDSEPALNASEELLNSRMRLALWGESLREIGILLLVFVPVDSVIEANRSHDWRFWFSIVSAVIGGFWLIFKGISMEVYKGDS